MPNRNGMGPCGQGPASGRGRGLCTDRDSAENPKEFARSRGAGRGIFCRRPSELERLQKEKNKLETSLAGLRQRRGNFREE
jgi:hypothetical protein